MDELQDPRAPFHEMTCFGQHLSLIPTPNHTTIVVPCYCASKNFRDLDIPVLADFPRSENHYFLSHNFTPSK
ncbi:hypothetical protein VTL71DRAFT_14298 [Oculimacula yallundae]|uniref:Uncharacterized protein n=1 Tax=Oculimacula yallundae TaxID=86028 RepID=A0ABR4CKD8_9HELO